MPTPNTYKKMANWLKPRRTFLLVAAFSGLALVAVPVIFVAVKKTQAFPNIPVALGVGVLVASWGLICIESWFSEKPPGAISRKLQASLPKMYTSGKAVMEWYASIFLVLWFCGGAAMAVVLLTKF